MPVGSAAALALALAFEPASASASLPSSSASVIIPDVVAGSSVVHVIDAVLLP